MEIVKRTLNFSPAAATDVVGYKLYIEPIPNPVTPESPSFDLGNVTSVELSTLPGMTNLDGVFNLGITAVDDAGNESDFALLDNQPLDFTAPDAPTNVSISLE